jgi:hypothetical protein
MTWTFVLLSEHGYADATPETSVYLRLSIVLAVVAGTAGTVLAVQAWRRFRGAPFGRALALLSPFMVLFTLFHAVLIVAPDAPATVEVIESAAFVLLVAFMVSMVRLHFRMSRSPAGAGSPTGTGSPAEPGGSAEETSPTETSSPTETGSPTEEGP